MPVDGIGTLYIADRNNDRVRRVDTDGKITTVAGTGSYGSWGDSRPATQARLADPWGVAVDGIGTLYIADWGEDRVRRVDLDGNITTVAGTGKDGFSGDGGPATQAQLNDPVAMAVDETGSLYIADRKNNRVRKVDPEGTITTVAGTGTRGFSGDGGPATQAQLADPSSVAVDNTGTLYIADLGNRRVRTIDADGKIATVAGTGTERFSVDGTPATQAQLALPVGVAVDDTGTLYIADQNNNRIRRVDTNGTITTVAGTGTEGFSGDGGPATQAHLADPFSVAVDDTGALYVADRGNDRVRRVDPDGTITTVAGTGTHGFSSDGGPANKAHLAGPSGVAVDHTGALYIVDQGNRRVRRVGTDGQ